MILQIFLIHCRRETNNYLLGESTDGNAHCFGNLVARRFFRNGKTARDNPVNYLYA
jgi:uncharacterized protein YcgI (DUF1989 family)